MEPEARVDQRQAETQTDEFEERPGTPGFVPCSTGMNASTQIEDSDALFDWDAEVEPLLAVLVGKVRRWPRSASTRPRCCWMLSHPGAHAVNRRQFLPSFGRES